MGGLGRSPLRSLPHRARERRRSEEGALGLRLDRRSHPRRSGRLHLKADRLSCPRFVSNQFRLLLHAAYWLIDTLRRKLLSIGRRRMQLDTLRLHLIKIGGRVRELLTKVRMHLASGHPGQSSWQALSIAFGGVRELFGLVSNGQSSFMNIAERVRGCAWQRLVSGTTGFPSFSGGPPD